MGCTIHRQVGQPLLLTLSVPYAVRVVNAYLLLGEPLTLVDPGADSADTREALEGALGSHGLQLEDVERIVITHQHHDHAGLAHWIRERWGAEVVAHHGSSPTSPGSPGTRWRRRISSRPA